MVGSPPRHPAGVLAAWLLLAAPAVSLAQVDSVVVHCHVFEDLDGNGLDDAEPPIAGVRITNGVDVPSTDGGGNLSFVVDRAVYRFATLTLPAGYRATTPWFARIDGSVDTVQAAFGLQADPASASDPVRWVHIADTQVQTWGDPWRTDDVLFEVNELAEPPLFVMNAGDLVEVGSDSTHWNNYVTQIAVSAVEVLPVVGNHDTLGTSEPLAYYEQWVGPPYYSREAGSWHFIAYNAEAAALGTPLQDTWLAADIAAAPGGSKPVIWQHRMLKEGTPARNQAWAALGVVANFSGHWHALQLAREPTGMLDLNLSRTRSGPLDRTPQAFGVVTMEADGGITYDLRRVHVDHRVDATQPAPGQTLATGQAAEILVQAYDTSSPVASVTASVSGPGGSVPAAALSSEGVSLWRGEVDVSALPAGGYTLSVSVAFDDGQVRQDTVAFELDAIVPLNRSPSADWPMFRKCLAGSSFTAAPLEPPLELAWTTPVPGLVALSSPVVKSGRVYLGTRAEHRVGEEGIVACDAETGEILWSEHVPGGIALAPAVTDGGILIASALSDSIWGLDAATGDILWNRSIPGARYDMTAPVFEGNKAWVGPEPRPMQVDWHDGSRDWQTEPGIGSPWFPYIYSAPTVSPSRVYYSFHGYDAWTGGFSVVDRATGNRETLEVGAFRSPIWTGDRLYVVGAFDRNDQRLSARDETGAALWTSSQSLGGGTGAPAVGKGVVVVAGASGAVTGLSAADGQALWSHGVGYELYQMEDGLKWVRATSATPAIADSVVWIGSLDGYLYALDLATGAERWKRYLGVPIASSAAISGNMLFVGASDGHLYAFTSTTPRPPTTGVPDPGAEGRASVLHLYPVRPNPGAGRFTIAWTQPAAARVRVDVYDTAGRLVRRIVDERRGAGEHEVRWDGRTGDGSAAAAGVYFARLRFEGEQRVRKLVRLGS